MSEDRRAVGDEDLMAYVDGECDEPRRRAVEAHIAMSPAAAARVDLWRLQRKILRSAFARVEAEPPPASVLVPYKRRPAAVPGHPGDAAPAGLTAQGWRPPHEAAQRPPDDAPPAGPPRRRWPGLAAAFVAGVGAALGGVAGYDHLRPHVAALSGRPSQDDESLARQAIAALAPPRAGGPDAPDNPAVAPARPRPIAPYLAEYRILGARAASSPDAGAQDAFCLLYARGDEPAASLCVARDERAVASTAVAASGFTRVGAPGGAAAVTWRQAGGRYALAAPTSEQQLRDFAARLSAAIAAFAL
ncbi:anti-sigma factor family protein [Methylocella sp.]|uniref:anti-sigma factor family protein n=1 Tax=Methylocella sp. TaxID=1978226 RepID=UPI003783DB8D